MAKQKSKEKIEKGYVIQLICCVISMICCIGQILVCLAIIFG